MVHGWLHNLCHVVLVAQAQEFQLIQNVSDVDVVPVRGVTTRSVIEQNYLGWNQ